MLNKTKLIIVYLFLILSFLFSKASANNEYFKCPEKILKIIKGQDPLLKTGSILGVNYVKFHINKLVY